MYIIRKKCKTFDTNSNMTYMYQIITMYTCKLQLLATRNIYQYTKNSVDMAVLAIFDSIINCRSDLQLIYMCMYMNVVV